jgi:hypothetical protein
VWQGRRKAWIPFDRTASLAFARERRSALNLAFYEHNRRCPEDTITDAESDAARRYVEALSFERQKEELAYLLSLARA